MLPKTVCTECFPGDNHQVTTRGWFQRRERSHIKLYGQQRFRVTTSAGSNTNTTWDVADLRKPLTSASRLCEGGHKLVLDEIPRNQCTNGDTIALERCGSLFAVRLWIPECFSLARLNADRNMKKKACKDRTLRGARETHMLFGHLTGLEMKQMSPWTPRDSERVSDTTCTGRVLATLRTPTRAKREDGVSHVT